LRFHKQERGNLYEGDSIGDPATSVRAPLTLVKVKYLAKAGEFLGNVDQDKILHIGESLERFRQDFRVIDSFRYLKTLSA
jgi:hypothetical protein